MAEPVALPNPRTLYTQLRECASAALRAQAALEFVRSCTGSEAGYLFLMCGGQLTLAASTQGVPAPQDMVAEVARTWHRELDSHPEDNKTETLELSSIEAMRSAQESPVWRNANAEAFERRLLSMYRGPNWLPVGLVMLRARDGRSLSPIRQVHVEALCNALVDSGDVADPGSVARSS